MESESNNCIFCQIAAGHSPAQVEYRDDDVVVFWDIQPVAPTHLLIIPKKHIPTVREASDEDRAILGKMLLAAAEVARRKGFSEAGYRVVMNTGPHAKQIVDHIHLHILAGTELGAMTSAKGNPTSQYS